MCFNMSWPVDQKNKHVGKQTIDKFLSRFMVGVSQEVQVKIAGEVTALVTSRDFCKVASEFFHEVVYVMI